MPQRIQMSRQRPWRAEHPDAVIVARPSRYGNPFIVGDLFNGGNMSRQDVVDSFRRALVEKRLQFSVAEVRRELAGRDLACWCKPSDPCHADVLLQIASSTEDGTK